MKKAFTLIELMVAVGLLAIVLSFAGIIFNASIDTHRTAMANAEIMQKLRAITDQLDADFRGLCKDGEIFVVWVPKLITGGDKSNPDDYERLDRIMFFANGNFQSFNTVPAVGGAVARICYMLARKGPDAADGQNRAKRVLARTQHIRTAGPAGLLNPNDPNALTPAEWYDWNNRYEYDDIGLQRWKHIRMGGKANILTAITGVKVSSPSVDPDVSGADVDPANDPNSIHMLLCEGVGEFKVQGWTHDPNTAGAGWRWAAEVDPNGDGNLADTDFFLDSTLLGLDTNDVPGVLYPYRECVPGEFYGGVKIRGLGLSKQLLNEANFNGIPGLGRALKFTFTLFDSKGIIEQGRTFTHIVYLK